MDAKKLFSFDGRVGRGVAWGVGIANFILLLVAVSIAQGVDNALVTLLAIAVILATLVVGTATNVKRWHDRDKSGYWYLISLIPIVGPIWSFIELGCLAGTSGENQYGSPGSGSPFVREPRPFDVDALPAAREWGR